MRQPIRLHLLATPHVSASSLFGLYDALSAAGKAWEIFVTGEPVRPIFDVSIVGPTCEPFRCASGTLVAPDLALDGAQGGDLVIVPGMNLSATEPLGTSEQASYDWLWNNHLAGSRVVAACSGAIYLAEAGLLDNKEATTHWAYGDLFRRYYSSVRLRLERSICFETAAQGVVTSGGTTAWQELALFLIANYGNVEHAVNAAKFWLMANRDELQAPYIPMIKSIPHADSAVQVAQSWIAENYTATNPVKKMAASSGIPATSFARRFRKATGFKPRDYVQTLRIEEAKHMLETSESSIAEIGFEVGYEDTPSFRRLFKRKTGLTPVEYRKMFGTQRFERYK
ncbi:MAG: helix-turn-helix domain-containing protein [Granulosicoccus sp.]|nr:helix-turn-helix domain-containing protein [Granulosicoccus sp.]